MTPSPTVSVKRLVVLLGFSVVLAACSAATGRSPGDDRSADAQGAAPEKEDAAVDSSGAESPTQSRPAVARGPESRQGRSVVGIARSHLGAPYRWGGSSPKGFDCSGFVRYVYAQVGVSLPHNAAEQYRHGAPVSRDQLEPGDLVFFDRLRHNGIYIGHGRFIHAGRTGKRVSISTLDEEWYAARWVGARRP
jgi:cell wall-associated NlpC family hydrolase